MKPVIAVDFDETIARHDENLVPNKVVEGAREALEVLSEKYTVVVYTARNTEPKLFKQVKPFLDLHKLKYDRIAEMKDGKILADHYIDDRAITFKDNWDEILEGLGLNEPEEEMSDCDQIDLHSRFDD